MGRLATHSLRKEPHHHHAYGEWTVTDRIIAPRRRAVSNGACALLAVVAAAVAFAFISLLISSPISSVAQSGRRQQQPSSTPKPSSPPSVPAANRVPSANAPVKSAPPAPVPTSTTTSTANRPTPDQTAIEVDDEDVIRVNSNLVTLPASVIDAQGRAITNLELKDFELRVDGEAKTIGELARSETPVRMAVLFDDSASLTASREFEKHAALKFFRRVLRPVDQAAIFSICTDPILEQHMTGDIAALERTIERFGKQNYCATAVFDAIAQAANYLRPHQFRKVIIVVSDGVDTTSNLQFEETLRLAQASDCQIYAVQIGHSQNANLRDLAAERRLQEFTAQTGGAVYTPIAVADLDLAFTQIAADLAQQYVLSYYPSGEPRDGRFHLISLRVPGRANLRVRTRKGYYAPKG